MAFVKGKSGNVNGRPKGTFQRHTQIAKLMRDRGDEAVEKVMNMALSGDTTCLKIWMDKILPNAKKDELNFDLPDLKGKTPDQLSSIMFEAMSGQRMSVEEINCIMNMIKTFKSSEDGAAIQELITKSNEIIEGLRLKNEREY
jgi:hypothetical protein